MKVLRNTFKRGKTIIVLSDLHLGAGEFFKERRNLLEDFFFDEELINLLKYFSTKHYEDRQVEIIFNGDFLDFLATPYVNYFEDEFWSEEASIKKLYIIRDAHREVFTAIANFLKHNNKKIVYIVGNHDAEILLPAVQIAFKESFPEEVREKIFFPTEDIYSPLKGIYLQHGHQYEKAHAFNPDTSLVKDAKFRSYIKPTWGSYYCINIINKFKIERPYINQIQPIKKFLIHGLVYDTFFTLRFMFSNVAFFVMVRLYLWSFYIKKLNFSGIIKDMKEELLMFQNYETLTRKFFAKHKDAKVLLVGHTHHPSFRHFRDGSTFINTGTWTKIISLDFSFNYNGHYLTFAKIDASEQNYELENFDKYVDCKLVVWQGNKETPYGNYFS